MDVNEQLQNLKHQAGLAPREEKIQETIQAVQDVYFQQEQNRLLTYWEFLWSQFQYTRKRWWALQAGLLLVAYQIIPTMNNNYFRVRSIGVIGCLFVVIMIPELWRNKETNSTQVEAACLYSLQQVYAARITLFGIVDVALMTCFSLGLGRMGFTPTEVMCQFLLPVTVTACICFSLLCGKQSWGEIGSIFGCLTWAGAWWLILMNEQIYTIIAPPVWITLFVIALLFLAWTVRKMIYTTNQYWEVDYCGVATD